jgi:prefoldin subunit 5
MTNQEIGELINDQIEKIDKEMDILTLSIDKHHNSEDILRRYEKQQSLKFLYDLYFKVVDKPL